MGSNQTCMLLWMLDALLHLPYCSKSRASSELSQLSLSCAACCISGSGRKSGLGWPTDRSITSVPTTRATSSPCWVVEAVSMLPFHFGVTSLLAQLSLASIHPSSSRRNPPVCNPLFGCTKVVMYLRVHSTLPRPRCPRQSCLAVVPRRWVRPGKVVEAGAMGGRSGGFACLGSAPSLLAMRLRKYVVLGSSRFCAPRLVPALVSNDQPMSAASRWFVSIPAISEQQD
jgi:hypothetical protein